MKSNKKELNAIKKFQQGISLGLAKHYSNAISDSVKRAFRQKRQNGEYFGITPYGYFCCRQNNKKISFEIRKKDAEKIIKIFNLFSTGKYTIQQLSENKVISLPKSKIIQILKNPFYKGIVVSRKYGPYKHKYDKIIKEGLFDKCQKILRPKQQN